MIRGTMIVVAVLGLGIAAVSAQQDNSAAALQTVMRSNGKVIYGDFGKMVKGQAPYDQATVDAGIAQLEDVARRLPTLFPESAKPGVPGAKYRPSEKIWAAENKADFAAKLDALAKAVASAKGTIKDVDTLRAAATSINNACSGCHETYQLRNS
jgi:cytochrome c556